MKFFVQLKFYFKKNLVYMAEFAQIHQINRKRDVYRDIVFGHISIHTNTYTKKYNIIVAIYIANTQTSREF